MYWKNLPENGFIFFPLSAYHGLLFWRYKGYGALKHDAFTSNNVLYQILCLAIMLVFSSVFIARRIDVNDYWKKCVFDTLVPAILYGWAVMFGVPVFLKLLPLPTDYPKSVGDFDDKD